MAERARLGQGLDSLLSTVIDEGVEAAEGVRELPIHQIELNPRQPRQGMNEEALEGLAESIRTSGVIQPILVRPRGEMYELVTGERRLRATRKAGLEAIPAVIRDIPDEKMLELALLENIQREDLNAIEKARAIGLMIDELGITQENCASRLGLSRPAVANSLRLLTLPTEVQEMVSRETISAGHARALLAIKDHTLIVTAARRVAARGLSVRQTEAMAARLNGSGSIAEANGAESAQTASLADQLQEALGCKVEVKGKGQKGQIIIHFQSYEEFERLYEHLTGSATPAL